MKRFRGYHTLPVILTSEYAYNNSKFKQTSKPQSVPLRTDVSQHEFQTAMSVPKPDRIFSLFGCR